MAIRRARARTPVDAAQANFNQSFTEAMKRAAASLGQPPGTTAVGDAEKVRQWGIYDPKVDRQALTAQIMTTGLPQEMLDPNSPTALAIVKAAPDLAPLYAQAQHDPELADVLAGFAENPLRYGLVAGIDDPEEQVKESNRLAALHQKQTARALETQQQDAGSAPEEGAA